MEKNIFEPVYLFTMKELVKQVIASLDEYYSAERLKEAFFGIMKEEDKDTPPDIADVYYEVDNPIGVSRQDTFVKIENGQIEWLLSGEKTYLETAIFWVMVIDSISGQPKVKLCMRQWFDGETYGLRDADAYRV
jgi:hypothetical protein